MTSILKKLKASETGMKIREKIFPYYDPNHAFSPLKNLPDSMKRYDTCESKKTLSQIRSEIALCKKYWKCFPYHYYMYDLYRKDTPLSEEALLNYIPEFFWYYLYLPHHSSYKFWMITDNKIITDLFFRSLHIPQPETLYRIINGRIYSMEMLPVHTDQLLQDLNREKTQKIFVKPAESGQGKGIHIFHKGDDGRFVSPDNTSFTNEFLESVGKNRDYIIQKGITQHPDISAIYPASINTVRIITENKGGNTRAVCSMLRIGRGHHEIDNASAGGIFLKIDTGSGIIGDVARTYDGECFPDHPDTHFVFQKFRIPAWEKIVHFARESAGKIPFFTHLAWDIAVTETGPVAIEINLSPGISGLQISCGGLRKIFGIPDPDHYWKNPGKRL